MAKRRKVKNLPSKSVIKTSNFHSHNSKSNGKLIALANGIPRRSSNGVATQKWIVEDIGPKKFKLNPSVSAQVVKLSNAWKDGKCLKEENFEIDHSPFKHCVIQKLLSDESHLDEICTELLKLPHQTMLNDLYSVHQACLLNVSDSYPNLKEIVKLIKGPLHSAIQKITGKKFSNKFTITASQYKYTDRLLCHDDNLSDRSVAFIFYLCKKWEPKWGGSLDLFECDSDKQPQRIFKSIYPSFGSFAFFEVTDSSYHQVAEVVTSKSMRISINGWFHGEDLPKQSVWHSALPKMLSPIQPRGCSLQNYINPTWIDVKTLGQVKSSFEQELSISLPSFLDTSTYEGISSALKDDKIVWSTCGPAHQRRYEVAQLKDLPDILSHFLKVIQSKQWFRFLSECTVEISPDVKPTPKCWFEVQRWQPGDYTVLVDNDPLNNTTGIDVHLYFEVGKKKKESRGGEVFYLGPDSDGDGNLEQALHLEPENNIATIVAHIEGMAVLTKYLDHRNKSFYKIYARYSQSL